MFVSRKVFVIALTLLLMMTLSVSASQMSDISGHWAEANIQSLVDKGAINGYPDGTFRPNNTISRAEFCSVLRGALGLDEVTEAGTFDDVQGHWAKGRIEALVKKGIIDKNLYSFSYNPDKPITREEIAMMAVNMIGGETDDTLLPFSDKEKIGSGYHRYVAKAYANNIIKGYSDGSFVPSGTATRAEAAVMTIRALGVIEAMAEETPETEEDTLPEETEEAALPEENEEEEETDSQFVPLFPVQPLIPLVFSPVITEFSSDKTLITKGLSATLTWETKNAYSVSITGIGTVSSSGTVIVAPLTTTTYTITAGTVTKSLTIVVIPQMVMQPESVKGKDAYFSSASKNQNISSQIILSVGGNSSANSEIRSIIQFDDISNIPENAIVTKAELKLRLNDTYNSEAFTISAFPVLGSWTENTVTWTNMPLYSIPLNPSLPLDYKIISIAQVPYWMSWDITSLAKQWVNKTKPNHGVYLMSFGVNNNYARFTSSDSANAVLRPMLVVSYYVP